MVLSEEKPDAAGPAARKTPDRVDALSVLEGLIGTVDAPPDWAAEHDHYLYGTPMRGGAADKVEQIQHQYDSPGDLGPRAIVLAAARSTTPVDLDLRRLAFDPHRDDAMHDEYRTRARVGEDGRLALERLPFAAGEEVEVTVVRAAAAEKPTLLGHMRGTVAEHGDLIEPVAEHEWDVLK